MKFTGITGIIPFTNFGNKRKAAGSSFLRVDGLEANSHDFKNWKHGHKYDNLIFQKAYWQEMMELFKGPKILDICDPDWVHDGVDIIEMGNLVHAITCSSEGLTKLLQKYFPEKMVVFIPDRLNFKLFPAPRLKHEGNALNVVWFGFIQNAHETLENMLPGIEKHKLKLTIIANKPYQKEDGIKELNPIFIPYDQRTIYNILKNADIVLNPRSDRAFFKYKSGNKNITSWKLGVPVAETLEDLDRLIKPIERNMEIESKYELVLNQFDVTQSANQYREVISEIRKGII